MKQNLENIKKGLIYLKDNDYTKAEIFFLNLVRKNPSNIQVYSYLIPVLIEQKKFSDALKFSERLFNLNKKNELGLIYIGIINYNLKKYPLAFEYFERALFINPKNFDALLNIGVTFRKLGNNLKAIEYFEKSLKINPKKSIVFYNLGSVYEEECDLEKAMLFFKKAISLNSRDFDSIHAFSLCQLTMHNFNDGLKNYELRWLKKGFEKYRYKHISKLESLNSISGKKILVWYEQGMGDTIQFSRFVQSLIILGANVTFEVQRPLLNFLKRQFNCEVTDDASKDNFDFQCPLMSLPKLFDMNLENIPSIKKYFKCEIKKFNLWKDILSLSKDKKNIGIAISGNVNQIYENRRRIDLDYFRTLSKSFKIFVIQKDLYQNDEVFLNQSNDIEFLGKKEQWKDFEDTSAIVENMDFIISIDTSLIHLASSMNKKAFLLLSKSSDWRWSHEKLNSPKWYDNLTIFRQKTKDNWEDVILEINKRII